MRIAEEIRELYMCAVKHRALLFKNQFLDPISDNSIDRGAAIM
ncbi:MAG: hypothetical protein QXH35_07255 [Nitrososphaerota archaeon]